ncbi:MAG TPA: N-succinylarginine dihydrolase [Caulobacterales bacterium]|nr:N-succinylarginine dihydrolase [Caulobacterales bacterium]
MNAVEANFDGLVGLTHNYAGLSEGNLASARNKDMIARPRDAALQGLEKMKRLAARGLPQGVLPPHERPFIPALRRIGFSGGDKAVWERAWREAPEMARRVTAASAMWAANAATVSPSPDCGDGRVHITPANLHTMAHRALESATTTRALRRIFANAERFVVHDALPAHWLLADEGAANHMRLSGEIGAGGLEIFVYGRTGEAGATRHPARQTLDASQSIARMHALSPPRIAFAAQAPAAIEAGAFHNDVVAVAHRNVLLFHEHAFADKQRLLDDIVRGAEGLFDPIFIEISEEETPLADAVASYLFNGQLVSPPGADLMTLILPEEARENPSARSAVEHLTAPNGPIGRFEFLDLRQSMRNGGGPACLRLRVELSPEELAAVTPGFFLTEGLAAQLASWIRRHYRETLAPSDLRDPAIITETRAALDELTRVLPLGSNFYEFQRDG